MRIRLLRNVGGRPDLREGSVAETDDTTAESLCRRGLAEQLPVTVIEAVPSNDIETVPPRRRKGKVI